MVFKHGDDIASLPFIEYDFVTVTQRVRVTSPLMGWLTDQAFAFRVGAHTLWNAAAVTCRGGQVLSACSVVNKYERFGEHYYLHLQVASSSETLENLFTRLQCEFSVVTPADFMC
jgi:hypothetical protein